MKMKIYNKTFLKSLIWDEKKHRDLRKNYQKTINISIDKNVKIDSTNYFENTVGKFKNITQKLTKKLLESGQKHENYLDYKFNYVSVGGQSYYFTKNDELYRVSTHWTELNLTCISSCYWNLQYKKDSECYGDIGYAFFGGKIKFSKLYFIKGSKTKITFLNHQAPVLQNLKEQKENDNKDVPILTNELDNTEFGE